MLNPLIPILMVNIPTVPLIMVFRRRDVGFFIIYLKKTGYALHIDYLDTYYKVSSSLACPRL